MNRRKYDKKKGEKVFGGRSLCFFWLSVSLVLIAITFIIDVL